MEKLWRVWTHAKEILNMNIKLYVIRNVQEELNIMKSKYV